MARKLSSISPDWWDYTTLDDELLRDVAKLSVEDLRQLSRPGFQVVFYDSLEDSRRKQRFLSSYPSGLGRAHGHAAAISGAASEGT